MSRDVKVGMLIGLGIVGIALVAVSVWPGGTVEERHRIGRGRTGNRSDSVPILPPSAGGNSVIEDHRPVQEDLREAARWIIENQPEPSLAPSKPSPPEPRIHIVAQGENLSSIANLHYGDANMWLLIAEANKQVLPDANRVRPGMRLVIPLPGDN